MGRIIPDLKTIISLNYTFNMRNRFSILTKKGTQNNFVISGKLSSKLINNSFNSYVV